MHVELPGETDAAVQLQAILRNAHIGFGAARLGEASPDACVRVAARCAVDCEREKFLAADNFGHVVGDAVLERLERGDRAPELLALHHVGDRDLDNRARPANGIGGDCQRQVAGEGLRRRGTWQCGERFATGEVE